VVKASESVAPQKSPEKPKYMQAVQALLPHEPPKPAQLSKQAPVTQPPSLIDSLLQENSKLKARV